MIRPGVNLRGPGTAKEASRGRITAEILRRGGFHDAARHAEAIGHNVAVGTKKLLLHEPSWTPGFLKGKHILPKKLVHGIADAVADHGPALVLAEAVPVPGSGAAYLAAHRAVERGLGIPKLAALKTQLQPHQQRVVDKIKQPDQPGLVVAHGLGSGKTLAAIAAQDEMQMPTSVVLPAALRANYVKEQEKHVLGKPPPTDIVSLEQAARSGAPPKNPLLVVDEAHRARTPGTKTSKMLKANTAEKRLLLTGSPLYNHPVDIAPLVNIASGASTLPESKADFSGRYVRERQVKPGLLDRVFRGLKPGVVEELNPRTREELGGILGKWVDYHPSSRKGFPKVTEEDIEVPMDPRQLRMYDAVLGDAPAWVAAKIRRGLPPSKQEAKELNSFMSGVRQVSNSTRAFENADAPDRPVEPKIERAFDELKKVLDSNPRAKAAVYSNWLDSGIRPYKDRLTQAGIPFGEFTGEMNRRERDELVKKYNAGELRTLLLSAAGGEGLDLKGTRLMQVLDPHWNEERGRQVIGRGARYLSHADLPEDEQEMRVQRFLSTRPKKGILENLGLKKPGYAADQYLTRLSADKARLNKGFTELLEERSQQPAAANAPTSSLHKAASVLSDISPTQALSGAALLAGTGLAIHDAYRGWGHGAHLKEVQRAMRDGEVNTVAYMRERDPAVRVLTPSVLATEEGRRALKDLTDGKVPSAEEVKPLQEMLSKGENAMALRFKKGKEIILVGDRSNQNVLEHEYGHIQDFRARNENMDEKHKYSRGVLHDIAQVLSRSSYEKGVVACEHAAWDHVPEHKDRDRLRDAAIGTYDKGFYRQRLGLAPFTMGLPLYVLLGASPKLASADPLGLTKEQREARRRADAHFKSDGPEKWQGFIKNVRRKSFANTIQADPRADEKLQRHTDQMNRLLTGKTLDRVKGAGGTYRIVQLRGSDTLGCTCGDWRFKRSVAPDGEQDCKHIQEFRMQPGQVKEGEGPVLQPGVDPALGAALYRDTRPATSSWLKTAPGGFTIVHEDKPVGVIGLKPVKKKGTLGGFIEVALVPEARGKGLGEASVRELLKKYPNVRNFGWTARKDNDASLRLLAKLDGGVFPRTVHNTRRVQAEGMLRRDGPAPEKMRQALAQLLGDQANSHTMEPTTMTRDKVAFNREGFKEGLRDEGVPMAGMLAGAALGNKVLPGGKGAILGSGMGYAGGAIANLTADRLMHKKKASGGPADFVPGAVGATIGAAIGGGLSKNEKTKSRNMLAGSAIGYGLGDAAMFAREALKHADFEDEHGTGGPATDSGYVSTSDRAAWRKRCAEAGIAEGDGSSLSRDKDGYYCHTQRARSKSYPSPSAIPVDVIRRIGSTG